jgi:hypothetical protein
MALLATERLAILKGGCDGGRDGARHVRDAGVLLCHLQQYSEAKAALEQYESWIARDSPADLQATIESMQHPSDTSAAISKEEADVVHQLIVKATQEALESTFSSS